MAFWIDAPWPMTEMEACNYAKPLGWVIDEDDEDDEDEFDDGKIMLDTESGLNATEIAIATMPGGNVASIPFYLTDIIRGDITAESTDFLNDQFARLSQEAVNQWGEGDILELGNGGLSIEWKLAGNKGRVEIAKGIRSITATVTTPQYASVLDDLGE